MKINGHYGNGRLTRRMAGGLAAAFMILLIFGCLGQKKQVQKQTFMDKWKERAKASGGYSPSARKMILPTPEKPEVVGPVKAAFPAETAATEKPLPTDTINMKMHDVQLAVLLRALARIANQNIMINENVTGKASININSAPWDQVFLGILKTHGLTYKWEGDIIRIVTIDDLKKELELQKENQNFKLKVEEYKRDIHSLKKVNEPLTTRVIPIRYGDLEPLKRTVEKVLKARRAAIEAESKTGTAGGCAGSAPGEVMMDEHSHALVIHARQSDMVELVRLIQDLDKPTLQIRIEAHIVEATENTARHLGVEWSGLFLNASGDRFNWVGSQPSDTGQTLYDTSQNPQWAQPSTGNLVNAVPGAIGTSGGSLAYQFQKKGIGLLSVQLKALQDQGELNILSSPAITTLDNKEASIESGKKVPFQTVEDGDVKIEFKDALLKLLVTPHVIDSQTLRLEIETNNDELDFANAVGGQPAITTRKAKTTVVLFDGQTTVIGGLSKRNVNESELGVPGLKDVPLLGHLFKGQSRSNQFDELLIFITPHILKKRTIGEAAGVAAQKKTP